jgi:hypothetical protein
MSKYSFDRISPVDFESMAQALLEKTYRVGGNLIQFGSGADGAREATWTQQNTHPDYIRPSNQHLDIPKEWVFQVKYHDIGQRGWSSARDAVVDDLEKELDKVVNKHKVPCHAYILITNVPFTGVRDLGTRDRISAVATMWKDQIPEIFVWDAADVSRLLDANESVRTAYLDTILPGDLIKAICKGATFHSDRTKSALRAYLKFVTERDGVARAEEAGDEPGLPLVDVFIDLTMNAQSNPHWEDNRITNTLIPDETDKKTRFLPKNYANTPSSFALLIANNDRTLLLGGPGLGKSTLTQFAAIYHAARLVDPVYALALAGRLKLPDDFNPENLDAHCSLRFPFRIELRRYARWMGEEQKNERHGEIARYIVEMLINPNVSSDLKMDDVFALAATDPILLILDGLDEVPHPEARKQILENLQVFLRRVQAENCDIQLLFSSRPKGYSGEFNVFEPFAWELNDLDRADFYYYCDCWLDKRIRDAVEKNEARERIERGMKSEAVQRLAQSLLQATVMLTIVRRKNEIPHQRHALYAKYVEVIFDREKEKSQIVRDHETVLNRLHERVGFELHRKMEQTNVESLDSESFRGYLLNVLEDYSGDNLGSRTVREVADEIVAAATDRLCLIVGKGKDQTDIDFVVQSYREYFAAVYLFNHPEADPDRVFQTLVRRGGYWANVMQFYVAQANANQQMRWVMTADDGQRELNSVDVIVELTRTRRTLANVLPEFNLQRNIDFDRALRIIFNYSTRWTWLKQMPILDLLRVLRGGSAIKILLDMFNDTPDSDDGVLAVELWILAGLASQNTEEFESIRAKIECLLGNESTSPVALATALEKKIKVDFSQCSISTFFKPGVIREKYLSPSIFSCQTPTKQCELLLVGFKPSQSRSTSFLAARMEEALALTSEVKIYNGNITLKFSPYLCRSPNNITALTEIRDLISSKEDKSTSYFYSIICAAMEPSNQDLDSQVRAIEPSIKEEHIGNWYLDNILGPSAEAFPSLENWLDFKKELAMINTNEPGWLGNTDCLTNMETIWIAFLFHAEEWPLLVNMNLLTENELTNLRQSPFGKLFYLPSIPLSIFEVVSFHNETKFKIPLKEILQVALQIIETRGVDRLGNSWVLRALLGYGEIETIDKSESESILLQVLSGPPLPSTWIAAFMRLCLQSGAGSELLIKLWQHKTDSNDHFDIPEKQSTDEWNKIVSDLLALDNPEALNIASRILVSVKTQQNNIKRFVSKLISTPPSTKADNYARIRALLYQQPNLDEFHFWSHWDQQTAYGCGEWSWLFKSIVERFEEVVETGTITDDDKLRDRLHPFIARRRDFPWQIPCAALDARLKLDERNLLPLQDAEWKQE